MKGGGYTLPPEQSFWERTLDSLQSFFVHLRRTRHLWPEFFFQTLKRIRQQKVNYCLGFFACFIVVLVLSLLVTVIGNAPVIFLRLAELRNG